MLGHNKSVKCKVKSEKLIMLFAVILSVIVFNSTIFAQIPSPKSFLGFEPADDKKVADWKQITEYFGTPRPLLRRGRVTRARRCSAASSCGAAATTPGRPGSSPRSGNARSSSLRFPRTRSAAPAIRTPGTAGGSGRGRPCRRGTR